MLRSRFPAPRPLLEFHCRELVGADDAAYFERKLAGSDAWLAEMSIE
jgi:hypothetical protein